MVMVNSNVSFPAPLPDDPNKWDGWSKYKSPNYYERLCLDPSTKPSNELIEEHCRALLRWWQKKLPLKNQPSNPIAQMLRSGLDESPRYLAQARLELLDPARRQRVDAEIAAQLHEESVIEFHKYLTFALGDGRLTADEEQNLLNFGQQQGLSLEEMARYIEAELRDSNAVRVSAPAPVAAAPVPVDPPAPAPARVRRSNSLGPTEDFMRMLRLSGLDSDAMTDDQRDAFVNMAENLGIDVDEAEGLVDAYLEEADRLTDPSYLPESPGHAATSATASPAPAVEVKESVMDAATEVGNFTPFVNTAGAQMLFVPSGEFTMGSEAPDSPPNEKPLTKVLVSRFYMSCHPVTNAQYEEFDPSHSRKRAPGAGDQHPVLYVSSLDAMKFCQWLSTRERRRYRLPSEAEWEYAARGLDGRKFPWGSLERRGDLANFADRNTVFAWSDREIDDGFSESSPVGAYPLGASPFGMQDMAGNVWEWCLDYFEMYRGGTRVNPRGAPSGQKRVYRGGSWKSRFSSLRATTRACNIPSYSCNDLGFRVVCECESLGG